MANESPDVSWGDRIAAEQARLARVQERLDDQLAEARAQAQAALSKADQAYAQGEIKRIETELKGVVDRFVAAKGGYLRVNSADPREMLDPKRQQLLQAAARESRLQKDE